MKAIRIAPLAMVALVAIGSINPLFGQRRWCATDETKVFPGEVGVTKNVPSKQVSADEHLSGLRTIIEIELVRSDTTTRNRGVVKLGGVSGRYRFNGQETFRWVTTFEDRRLPKGTPIGFSAIKVKKLPSNVEKITYRRCVEAYDRNSCSSTLTIENCGGEEGLLAVYDSWVQSYPGLRSSETTGLLEHEYTREYDSRDREHRAVVRSYVVGAGCQYDQTRSTLFTGGTLLWRTRDDLHSWFDQETRLFEQKAAREYEDTGRLICR